MSQGEIYQIEKAIKKDMTEKIYYEMVSDKTASLFSAACELGCITVIDDDKKRRALSKFDLESVPILRNTKSREPYWPKSVRGSITHSEGFAAAAVGLTKDVSGIGIDLESLSRIVDFNIRRHVCVDKEREFLESLPTEQANHYLRIIFSAKESIFKCFFPISQTYLYFQDAEIIIDDKNCEFSFLLSKACTGITSAGFQHSGRFSIKDELLLTSIYI